MAKKKRQLDTWAPAFGCWNETEHADPPPGAAFLGLWQDEGPVVRLEVVCCFYYNEDGKRVDPDTNPHVAIRYWQMKGEQYIEVPAPDMWCETRWVIPVGLAWRKAHGLR